MRRRWRRRKAARAMRKINIGVSVAPPNVVHTSPYVAKELGFFAKRCIDPNIIQFEGGAVGDLERGGRARLGHRERQRRRHRPRHEGAAVLGLGAAHAAGLHGVARREDRGRSQGQEAQRHRRRRRRLQLAHGPRGPQAPPVSPSTTRNSSPPPRPAACRAWSPGRSTASRSIPRTSISPRSRSRRSISWCSWSS